ncbi:MAG: nucleotidyl transferase AbiEii/AbiGii toxin family protein [Armatimonadota bacterium]|jgi:hypothetical protein
MTISREKLLAEAEATGFRIETLEKAIHLLNLLERFQTHPFLKGRLGLKGGTALNLFVFDLPRLSVDLGLNYIGAVRRDAMLAERPKVERAIRAVCSREGFSVRRAPEDHAGGKWWLRHETAVGQEGNLEVDLNYMHRLPLWAVMPRNSRQLGSYRAMRIPVLDIHELAAGKLAALLSRRQARDVFDVHQVLTRGRFDHELLRITFVAYGAMNRRDWRTVSVDDVEFDGRELENRLVPLLRGQPEGATARTPGFGERLVGECLRALDIVLPLSEPEREFLDCLLERGEIAPWLLTRDQALAERISRQPLLHWKALNMRRHKGL